MLPDFSTPAVIPSFIAACAIDALNHNERSAAEYLVSLLGGRLGVFRANKASLEVDVSSAWFGQDVMVSIYGTENKSQAFRELTSLSPGFFTPPGGFTSSFFIEASHELEAYLDQRVFAQGPPSGRVVIVGHSLGGAVAYLYGLLLKAKGGYRVDVMTFGEPKSVSNHSGTEVNNHVRIVCGEREGLVVHFDPVVFMPPSILVYPLTGKLLGGLEAIAAKFVIGPSPRHFGDESWFTMLGERIADPFGQGARVVGDLIAGTIQGLFFGNLVYHFLDTAYIPMTLARYADLGNRTLGQMDQIAMRWMVGYQPTSFPTPIPPPFTASQVPSVVASLVPPVLSGEAFLRQRQVELTVAAERSAANSVSGVSLPVFQGVQKMQVPKTAKVKVVDNGNGFWTVQVGGFQLATFSNRSKAKTFAKKTNQYFGYFDRTDEITLTQFQDAWKFLLQVAATGGVGWIPNPGITLV